MQVEVILKKHLELGGKAPVIVYDDADINQLIEGIRAFGYYNAGQDCTAACRIFADKKVYDNVVADLSPVDTVPPCGTFVPIILPSHPGKSLESKELFKNKITFVSRINSLIKL